MRTVLEAEGVQGLDEAYLRRFIGYHLRELYADALPGQPEERYDEMIRHYRRIYPARRHAGTKVYPGVPELLAELPGWKSTATTKATTTVVDMLSLFGLLERFDRVQGTDGFPAKPDPEVILRSLHHFDVKPEECLFIGDAAPDMEAGRKRASARAGPVRIWRSLDDGAA